MGLTKEQREVIEARMLEVMREDPSVTIKTLAQRFNVSTSTVRRIRKTHGIEVENARTELLMRKEMKKAKAPKGHYKGGRI